MSGLVAGWELRNAGVDLRIFEQARHPGGRAFTIRDAFDDGRIVDAGAMGADRSYAHWLGYCERFGVSMRDQEAPEARADSLLVHDGVRYSGSELAAEPAAWPVPLTAEEKPLAPSRLLFASLRPIAAEIGAVENVLEPRWARYDDLSLADFLKEERLSDAALALIERSLNYNSLKSVSTLSALRDTARRLQGPPSPVSPRDGHGALPDAMAAKLEDRIDYDSELLAIRRRDGGVTLTLAAPDGRNEFSADLVILTLPFTALAKVAFEPALPDERRHMVETLPYTKVAKTFVRTRSRFWEGRGDFSVLTSNSPFERIFNLSAETDGERGMLLNWINGDGLDAFGGLSAAAHADKVIDWIGSLWPDARDQLDESVAINWADSYAGGAYAHYAPGQLQAFAPAIPKPVGPLHFAGEHTELVAPGLEGAVVSGMRAANEVLNKLSLPDAANA